MDIKTFTAKKQLSKDGKYYFVKDGENLYIQPVNHDKQFRLPTELKKFKKIAIWRIGPGGKKLVLNNLEVTA